MRLLKFQARMEKHDDIADVDTEKIWWFKKILHVVIQNLHFKTS